MLWSDPQVMSSMMQVASSYIKVNVICTSHNVHEYQRNTVGSNYNTAWGMDVSPASSLFWQVEPQNYCYDGSEYK